MTFSLFGDNTELKELKLKKEIQLSELGKKIMERYLHAQSIHKEAVNILTKQALKKNLNEEELKEFGRKTDQELDDFVVRLTSMPDVKGFLVKELFTKGNGQREEDFEEIKFFLIIINNEYRIIKILIEQYEVLEQERRELNQKLIETQQS